MDDAINNNHIPTVEDGLWDELSHQQSREIQQHHARTLQSASINSSMPHNHWTHRRFGLLRRIYQQTREEALRFSNIVYDAALDAWREHEERQLRDELYPSSSNSSSSRRAIHHSDHTYLRDFGIAADGNEYVPLTSNERNQQQQQQAGENEFIFLPRLSSESHYGAVANLDLFFGSLYYYYYHRGLVPILGKGVVQLVSLLFTLFLSVFLCVYVDWPALANCVDEASCHDHFVDYLHKDPFYNYSSVWSLLVILLYITLFLFYAAFATWSCLQTVRQALLAKFVFEERLGISARKLQGGAVDWNLHVVDKLLELQQSGEYRIAINGQDLDALVIATRILRKENFMVALFNKGLIDLRIPRLGNHVFFCSSLEWSLYFCILNFMFNHKYQIRPAFYLDHGALRRRFIACGVVHLAFLPFLLFFTTLHFGLQNAYDWKSTKKYLGPREWSLSSKWLFREFNELQHHFESRLYPSYEAAEKYLALFGQSEVVAACGRILVFIGGSLGAVLFVFAAINDAILLHVRIADWNLLWFAGMVGVVYSVGKGMMPSEEIRPRRIRNLYAETDAALSGIATHTHYYMPHWKGRAHDETTYKIIKSMIQFKAQLFVLEIASLLLAPYILCVSLAQSAESICEFIFLTKSEFAGAGEVCGYATFDFDKYEDEAWEGRTMAMPTSSETQSLSLSESVLRTRNVDEARRLLPVPKTRLGKMEKSFFNFQVSLSPCRISQCWCLRTDSYPFSRFRQRIQRGNVPHQVNNLLIV
ncbi:hypothetical protein MPSEU_001002100 [Mayamaea pseudoterrestris]|nr:hypothetical protein MPSEU_001002100 [Mayamaea pseudoterrestris]